MLPCLAMEQAAADQEWREQCRRNLERNTMTHIRYGFAHVHKPVIDDAPYRIFDSMQEYRVWCHRNLPRYLGFRLAQHAGEQIPAATSR